MLVLDDAGAELRLRLGEAHRVVVAVDRVDLRSK